MTPAADDRADGTPTTEARTVQEMAYDTLLRAHQQDRVALLAHVLQEAQRLAGATGGLFEDDLACAILWCDGQDAPQTVVDRMLERLGAVRSRFGTATTYVLPLRGRGPTMATATGWLTCHGLAERAAAGDWPWRPPRDPVLAVP